MTRYTGIVLMFDVTFFEMAWHIDEVAKGACN